MDFTTGFMKKNISIITYIILIALVYSSVEFAHAQIPTFPICTNPQGKIIAEYETGTHAIVGQVALQTGKDTVYALDDQLTQVTQCFCPPTQMQGIQTNWLQSSNLSEAEQHELQNNGWLTQSNGATWGLATKPYLAQNLNYTCNGSGQEANPPIITAKVESVTVTAPTTSNQTNTTPSTSNTPLATPQNTPTTKHDTPLSPRFPNTGDNTIVWEIFGLGSISLLLGFFIKKITV